MQRALDDMRTTLDHANTRSAQEQADATMRLAELDLHRRVDHAQLLIMRQRQADALEQPELFIGARTDMLEHTVNTRQAEHEDLRLLSSHAHGGQRLMRFNGI